MALRHHSDITQFTRYLPKHLMNEESDITEATSDVDVADEPAVAAPVRYHGLDALRGIAMMLGIVLHAALSYFLADDGYGAFWPQDDQQSVFASYVFNFIHTWRMPTFFLLAGFFAHLVLDRRGDGYFFNDRVNRILVPFVIFGVVMATIFPTIWESTLKRELILVNPLDIPIEQQAIGHLWFLYHLVYLYAILMISRWVAGKISNPLPLGRVLLAAFVNHWQVPLVLLFAFISIGRFVENVEDYLLWPIGAFDFLFSLVPFLVGYGLYKRKEMVVQLAGTGMMVALLSAGLVAFVLREYLSPIVLGGSDDDGTLGLVFVLVDSAAAVCFTFGLIGLFQRLFTGESAAIRWIADASYWVYIVHLPLVLLIAYSMFELPWPAELKFLIVCCATATIGFGSYWAFVRYTPIGTMLNGKRVRGHIGRPVARAST